MSTTQQPTMHAQRTVEIANVTGYMPPNYKSKPYDDAVGYLAMWAHASGTYTHVVIHVMHNGDINAAYYRDRKALASERAGYVLYAQRDPDGDSYSFHS